MYSAVTADLTRLSALKSPPRSAKARRARAKSCEAFLALIAAKNPALGAFTDVTAARALADADGDRPRRARPGEALGPLAGAPFAVKNLFDVAGLPTRAGSKINRERAPAEADATLVDENGGGRRRARRRAQHGRIRL